MDAKNISLSILHLLPDDRKGEVMDLPIHPSIHPCVSIDLYNTGVGNVLHMVSAGTNEDVKHKDNKSMSPHHRHADTLSTEGSRVLIDPPMQSHRW